ncbi:MAG: PQQ-dependent sugar dehydrogenase [Acidobacteriaceae bacterium]|nr:PQQ-dependent sugar dehydrogenase [Acidobacteriaceae bacterium]
MRQLLLCVLSLLLVGASACAQVDINKLHVPPGFHITIFADTESQPRMMTWSPGGVLMAASQDAGTIVAMPDPHNTGKAEKVVTVLTGLNGPNSLAFNKGKLYVAEMNRVTRYDWDEANLRATNPQKIADLPGSGGGHMTRTILFANGKMYVSAGSSCNVCKETDERRASVMEFNEDGSGQRIFARGLRNAVGLTFNPHTGTVWTSENGRDWLGDNLPPDEVNDLGKSGGDFGWPYCYGNRVPDLKFSRDAASRCASTVPAKVELQAHSAPLGLAFNEGQMFPAEYRGNLFVAFHGSWNRSVPTGYKVVRITLDSNNNPMGVEDFITGWMPQGATRATRPTGRPVGVLFGQDGSLYVSDDLSGAVYRVTSGK